MLRRIKSERELTVLLTTHYMDEADKLCDRIAIVDHGRIVALDSPLRLKAAVSSDITLEAAFSNAPSGWSLKLASLPGVESVSGDDSLVKISSRLGPAATMALLELAAAHRVTVTSLQVTATSLDDVFVHFTGRQLRDALQAPSPGDRNIMYQRRG